VKRPVKYVFITGGVVSSLGKGIVAASLGGLLKDRVDRLIRALGEASRTDTVTGLLNRRAFVDTLEMELERGGQTYFVHNRVEPIYDLAAKIRELVSAGVNQINISMNYPDARQDQERGIPGLFERLERTVPKMVAEGMNVFTFASMLMVDNMHDAEPPIRLAHKWGINIAFSGYNDLKNGNQKHMVSKEKMAEFKAVCARVIQLKRELGNVMTSDYFFETLPEFYEKRKIDGCEAGKIMIHVTPKGMVQPCAELAPVAHYSEFLPGTYAGPNFGSCFDACRSDVTRADVKGHVAFSSGIHYCLGAAIARMEGEVGLRSLFTRFPDLAPAGGAVRRPTVILRGWGTLPVRG